LLTASVAIWNTPTDGTIRYPARWVVHIDRGLSVWPYLNTRFRRLKSADHRTRLAEVTAGAQIE